MAQDFQGPLLVENAAGPGPGGKHPVHNAQLAPSQIPMPFLGWAYGDAVEPWAGRQVLQGRQHLFQLYPWRKP